MVDIKPKVSVIIPTYNRAHIITRAIQSVLDQTYKDFEIIIVDDGSTDNTESVVKSFNDNRIIYIRSNNTNKGVASARNIGIKLSKAEYIAFQDSDDVWYPYKLEKIMKVIEDHSNIDFIYSYGKVLRQGTFIRDVGKNPGINNISKKELIINLFRSNSIPTQGVVVRKDKIIKVGGFDESFISASDHELWLRLIPICDIYYLDEPLFDVNFSEESITINVKLRLRSQLNLFNKNKMILRKQTDSMIRYYLIRQMFLSNIFHGAAWDLSNRTNTNNIKAMFYYIISFITFPPSLFFRLYKKLFKM
jgi:glycosyltransferase involved in cell wall biosynthesis